MDHLRAHRGLRHGRGKISGGSGAEAARLDRLRRPRPLEPADDGGGVSGPGGGLRRLANAGLARVVLQGNGLARPLAALSGRRQPGRGRGHGYRRLVDAASARAAAVFGLDVAGNGGDLARLSLLLGRRGLSGGRPVRDRQRRGDPARSAHRPGIRRAAGSGIAGRADRTGQPRPGGRPEGGFRASACSSP